METLRADEGPARSSLVLPFDPLTLRRPMRLFPTALGLPVGEAAVPGDDFLANLIFGRPTFLALVRALFGDDFKNFQNYAHGRVRTTPATLGRLLAKVEGSQQVLDQLSAGFPKGAPAAAIGMTVRIAEGFAVQIMRVLLSRSLKCPNCGHELISRPAQWWASQSSCSLAEPEWRFVDRILLGMMFTELVPLIGKDWPVKEAAVREIADLCAEGAHPFRHWLQIAQRAWQATSLASLAVRAAMPGNYPAETLHRCGRGEMLTLDTINDLTSRLRTDKDRIAKRGLQARALAFAIDFIVAADRAEVPIGPSGAQALVQERFLQLYQDLRYSFMVELKHAPGGQPAAPSH